jgi:hypothetical protein
MISIQRLVEGPPKIISMAIVGVTPVGGYYNLDVLQPYTARIIVDSGTISYLIRVEGSNLSPNITQSPSCIVDKISANSGTKKYDFIITPTVDGIFQLAFQIRDRSTWNVYDVNGGIAVQVRWVPPQIVSTTIEAAEIVDDRYQLNAGKSYTAAVIVSSGNVTYDTRIEGSNNSETLGQSPSFQDKTIPRFSGNHVFQFTFQPSALGIFQIAFQLRDVGTSNILNADGGVAMLVLPGAAPPAPPRIISTTILDAPIDSGRYQLVVGKRYLVKVIVAAGVVAKTFSVEQNEDIPSPTWANVHNDAGSLWRLDPEEEPKDFTFTIAPTFTGTGQVAFMLRDSPLYPPRDGWLQPGTGKSYGHDGGVAFEARAEKPGVYGTVMTTSGTPIHNAKVTIYPSGGFVLTHSNGTYQFPTLIHGTYRIVISKDGFSTSEIVNINFSGPGFSADAQMEEEFPSLIEAHIIYKRYIDYSHGMTLIHMLELPRATTHTALLTSRFMLPEDGDEVITFQTPSEIAEEFRARALINGGFFDYGTGHAVGYYYSDGYQSSDVMNFNGNNPPTPVLGICGISTDQTIRIVSKQGIFSDPAATDWNATGSVPLWDDPPRDGVSDVSYAVQMDAYLNQGDTVEVFTGDYAKYWARTSVGIKSTGSLLLVVADGEGIDGAQGASYGQLGEFFRDVLGTSVSMALDGGGSSVMAVKSGTNYKQLTKNTAENPRWHIDANADNGKGVLNYLMVR